MVVLVAKVHDVSLDMLFCLSESEVEVGPASDLPIFFLEICIFSIRDLISLLLWLLVWLYIRLISGEYIKC